MWCHSASIENNTATVVNVGRPLRRSSEGRGEERGSGQTAASVYRERCPSVAPLWRRRGHWCCSVSCFQWRVNKQRLLSLQISDGRPVSVWYRVQYRPDTDTEYWYRSKPTSSTVVMMTSKIYRKWRFWPSVCCRSETPENFVTKIGHFDYIVRCKTHAKFYTNRPRVSIPQIAEI